MSDVPPKRAETARQISLKMSKARGIGQIAKHLVDIRGKHLKKIDTPNVAEYTTSACGNGLPENRLNTICVEGNIGCGKTTFLEFFRNRFQTAVIAEPVEKWRNVEGENLFHYLYKDPTRYSLAFQTYVQLTMMELHMAKPRLMERSIYSARYCFVENLHKLNHLSRLEYVILDKWFKHLVLEGASTFNDKNLEYQLLSKPTGVEIDMIIYLRCKPQILIDRVRARSRTEEKNISYEYLRSLHDLHEDWLISREFPVPAPVLVLDTNCSQESLETLYEKAAPYILGEKQMSLTPTMISVNDDSLNDNYRTNRQ